MLGKVEGRRRREWQRMRWLDGITDSVDETEQTPGSLVCCRSQRLRHHLVTEQQQPRFFPRFPTFLWCAFSSRTSTILTWLKRLRNKSPSASGILQLLFFLFPGLFTGCYYCIQTARSSNKVPGGLTRIAFHFHITTGKVKLLGAQHPLQGQAVFTLLHILLYVPE